MVFLVWILVTSCENQQFTVDKNLNWYVTRNFRDTATRA